MLMALQLVLNYLSQTEASLSRNIFWAKWSPDANRKYLKSDSQKKNPLGEVIKGLGWLREEAHQINVANGDTGSTFEARVQCSYLQQSISQNGWTRSRR